MIPKHFHFIGICGTAMGAVASAIAAQGHKVTGSDKNVYPPMSTFLESKNIPVFSGFSAEHITPDIDYIIVGNAISRGSYLSPTGKENPELEAVLDKKLRYFSLPEFMREFFLVGKKNYVVSGTHGKTTTTSLLTWIFEHAGKNPSFMIGGIAKNLGCGGRFTASEYTVLEGDEYDTAFFDKRSKFLHYLPDVAIVNNIEFDHADIYEDIKPIKTTFTRLLKIIPRTGLALINGDDANCLEVAQNAPCPVESVGLGETCTHQIKDIEYSPKGSSFSLKGERFSLPMAGEFNVRNAAMAICAAKRAGIESTLIQEALTLFEGIARRQEIRGIEQDVTVIDDFAHHPTAIEEALKGLRHRFPHQKLWAIFEPRSNTTRRDTFQRELATALSQADEVVLAKVNDQGKVPEGERLNVDKLIADIQSTGTPSLLGENTEHIIEFVSQKAERGDVLIVMSNGGFENIHIKLLDALKKATL